LNFIKHMESNVEESQSTSVIEEHLKLVQPEHYAAYSHGMEFNLDSTGEKKIIKVLINNPSSSSRRVEEKCEVKFYFQKYVFDNKNLEFKLYDRTYKNIVKKNIEKMTAAEFLLRKCLLCEMYDEQTAIFKVPFIGQFKFTEFLKEAKVKEEEYENFEEFLYFKITIESILFQQPPDTKTIPAFEKNIQIYISEIRYLIKKENYTDGEKWANSIIQKFFNMSKEMKKLLSEDKRRALLPLFKGIFLNKTFCLIKKQNSADKSKDYDAVIKTIVKEYYIHYGEKDDKYIKITARLAFCYHMLHDLENAKNTLNELINLTGPDHADVLPILKKVEDYEKSLKSSGKKKMSFMNYQNNVENEDAFEWDTGLSDKEIIEALNSKPLPISVIKALNN
jgi:hypothetical protein